MGTRSTLTVAVSDVLEHVGDKAGPDPLHEFVFSLFMGMTNEKFLPVIGLAAGQRGYSLEKEGWTRHQVNGPVPLKGGDIPLLGKGLIVTHK